MSTLLDGHRASELAEACDVLDALSCSDLQSVLTLMSERRARQVNARSVVTGNRFHQPAEVSQRRFHEVEAVIFAMLEDVEFVELSPVQPFGINTVLADISAKNVVSALRGCEVNADATTALFRVALARQEATADPVRLAANVRTVRAQAFDPGSKLLPHFKVFAQVSVGRQGPHYGDAELRALARHLVCELAVLHAVFDAFAVADVRLDVSIGNVLFSRELAEAGVIDVPRSGRAAHTVTDIPERLPFGADDLGGTLRDLGFNRGVKVTELFREIIAADAPELLPRLWLDLRRRYGVGYYQHICYKIAAFHPVVGRVPLSDGGTTNWPQTALGHRRLFCAASGVGTELLCRHLIGNEGETR